MRRLATDLSEADRRKNEFLAMLAHELRNPLAPISNATRALRLSDGRAEGCKRRPRCWSVKSARWRGWSTTCST
jgi:signal transduction histidine kinase